MTPVDTPAAPLPVRARRIRAIFAHGWQLRTEGMVALLNLATVATGFLLQIIVLRFAGDARDADAYFATSAIPQVALSIAVNAVTGALLPQLARIGTDERPAAVRALLLLVMAACLPIAVVLFFLAPWWTLVIFPGFADDAGRDAIALAGLAALSTPFAIATSVLSGYLYAERRFAINEGIALGSAGGLAIAAALLIPVAGITALGWLLLARFVVQGLLQALFLPRVPLRQGWAVLAPVWRRTRALLAGSIYFKNDILVDRYLLSLATAGALSKVVFAQSIFTAAAGVLGQALANTASPTLSQAHHVRDKAQFGASLRRNFVLLGLASVLLFVAAVALVPPVASLLTAPSVTRSGVDLRLVLLLFGGVPIGACMGALLANAFYAMGDTRTPTVMTIVTFTIFLIAKVIVFNQVGIYAFCALTSVYYLANCGIMAGLLRRKMHQEFAA